MKRFRSIGYCDIQFVRKPAKKDMSEQNIQEFYTCFLWFKISPVLTGVNFFQVRGVFLLRNKWVHTSLALNFFCICVVTPIDYIFDDLWIWVKELFCTIHVGIFFGIEWVWMDIRVSGRRRWGLNWQEMNNFGIKYIWQDLGIENSHLPKMSSKNTPHLKIVTKS